MKSFIKASNLCDDIIKKDPANIDTYIQKSKILRWWSSILSKLDSYESYLNDAIKSCDEGISHATSDAAKGALLREKSMVNHQGASDKSLASAKENILKAAVYLPNEFDSVVLMNIYRIQAERALKKSPSHARKLAIAMQDYANQSSGKQFENPASVGKQALYFSQAAYLLSLLKKNSDSKKYFDLALNTINSGLSKYSDNFDLNLIKAYIVLDMIKSEANSRKTDSKKIEQLFILQNESFEKALSMCPNSVAATYPYSCCLLNQAQFYKKQKNFELANKLFDKALSMSQNYITSNKKPSRLADAVNYIAYKETKNAVGYEGILNQYPEKRRVGTGNDKETRFELPERPYPRPAPNKPHYIRVPGGIITKKESSKFGYRYIKLPYLIKEKKSFLNTIERVKARWLPFNTI
jgi:tetratricopeptide (TPR) repeat protein